MRKSITAKRGVLFLITLTTLLFVVCFGSVIRIAIINGDKYKAKAESQQLSVTTNKALRGTIYDRNMHVLAQSASVWLVYVNPSKVTNENMEAVIAGLTTILGLDGNEMREKILKNADYGYLEVAGQVEYEKMSAMKEYIYANDLYGIVSIDEDTIRYYPNGNLCSTMLGFTGKDDVGLAGLEYYYNDELTGVDGRTVTAQDGQQQPMPGQFMTQYEAQQGLSPILTVDAEIQTILENALYTALIENDAQNVYGIVMDVETGAILAMANLPDYDPNDPYTLDELALAEIAALPEEEQSAAYSATQNNRWKNKAIADFYEPGSVAKVFLVASALEEGVIDTAETYECGGRIQVGDRSIKDYNPIGHGLENLEKLFINSCNTFSVHIGVEHLGKELFYKYFQAFGFAERTGIDLSGEGIPVASITYHDPEISFSTSDLASSSFGQSFTVTPLQMITAISAVANDGKLMTPYIVEKWLDGDGNTVDETLPNVRRQVISAKTATTILSYMEEVIKQGTGTNAYVPGYRIAGKTGTSEKLGTEEVVYIASFAGVAPADNPEVAVLIIIDEPGGVDYSGGVIAAPVGGEVFGKVLPYLGIEPVYSDDELEDMSNVVPSVIGDTLEQAQEKLDAADLEVRVIGNGESVISQTPNGGRTLMSGGTVILYTEADVPAENAEVPDFTGMSVSEANYYASLYDLNIEISGSAMMTSDVVAYRQSVEPGTSVELGSIITVDFRSNSAYDDGY
ncbi:MAG: PASTA domain-containing protein [Ruminococcaceae bacterium]|nr:PASTA domain-containing protein [Oscillospiraceae bacterium]